MLLFDLRSSLSHHVLHIEDRLRWLFTLRHHRLSLFQLRQKLIVCVHAVEVIAYLEQLTQTLILSFKLCKYLLAFLAISIELLLGRKEYLTLALYRVPQLRILHT